MYDRAKMVSVMRRNIMVLIEPSLGFKYKRILVSKSGVTMFNILSKFSLSSPLRPGLRSKSKLTARGIPF